MLGMGESGFLCTGKQGNQGNLKHNVKVFDQAGGGKAFGSLGGWSLRYALVVLMLALGVLLSGCVQMNDPETSQEFHGDVVGVISSGESVGQTFVSLRGGLNGLALWLSSSEPDILVTFDLFHSPGGENPIYRTKFSVQDGATHIEIPTQPDQPKQSYYFELSTSQGIVNVLGRDEDCYALGEAFSDGAALEGDLAFRGTYAYGMSSISEDLGSLLRQWQLYIALTIILFIPGWLGLEFSGLGKEFDAGERIGISAGLSLAIIPSLMLWTTLLGIRWNREVVLVGAGIMTTLLLWHVATLLLSKPLTLNFPKLVSRLKSPITILGVIFFISFFVRTAMIRDVGAPLWVDSIHHTLIAKAIIATGGYPDNYLPFVPFEARLYHPGYHSVLAAFHWLSGFEIHEAMLVLGQVLNALMVFAIYTLTRKLVKDKTASLVAALITGLVTAMPAYYTSWGRYTQLAGLLVLPVSLIWISPRIKGRGWFPTLVLGAVSLGGLTLIHYRVLVFFGCLVIATWVGYLYRYNQNAWKTILSGMKQTAAISICGLLVILPWLGPTYNEFAQHIVNKGGSGIISFQAIHTKYHTAALGIPALILAGIGLFLGLYKRRRFTIIILVWVAFLFAVANPRYFRIPILRALINQSSVEIMLFIPIAILGGYASSQILSGIQKVIPSRLDKVSQGINLMVGLFIAILGAQKLLTILNPDTILFRKDDEIGISWIEENIPEGETIVINPKGWGYGLYMGADGGYWISPLANLPTVPPNVLYGMSIEAIEMTNPFVETLLPIGDDPEKIQELFQEYGYRYIYIGSKGGVISPKALNESPRFLAIFNEKDTWVFKMIDDQ